MALSVSVAMHSGSQFRGYDDSINGHGISSVIAGTKTCGTCTIAYYPPLWCCCAFSGTLHGKCIEFIMHTIQWSDGVLVDWVVLTIPRVASPEYVRAASSHSMTASTSRVMYCMQNAMGGLLGHHGVCAAGKHKQESRQSDPPWTDQERTLGLSSGQQYTQQWPALTHSHSPIATHPLPLTHCHSPIPTHPFPLTHSPPHALSPSPILLLTQHPVRPRPQRPSSRHSDHHREH